MMVKRIERAMSQSKAVPILRLRPSALARHKDFFLDKDFFLVSESRAGETRPNTCRTRLLASEAFRLAAAILLSIALLLPVTAAPSKAVLFKNDKKASEKLHRDARKAIRDGEYEKAAKLYNKALDLDDKDTQARLGAALAYLKDNDYRLCYDRASEVIAIDPNNARAHALVAMSILRSGFVGAAVQKLVEANKLDPKEAMVFGAAAEIDYYEGRSKESRQKAMRAHQLDSNEPDYLLIYARASSRIEMFTDAAEAYERFLRIAPKKDHDRRELIEGLIRFYRRLAGIQIHELSGAKKADVPFRLGSDRRPYIEVKINGRDANFVIDTGSGFTVISKESAKRLGVSEIARGGKSQGVGGDGKFKIVYGLLNSLQLGDVRIRSVPCFIRPFHSSKDRPISEQADGFIGLSVLSHFLTELDYEARLMRLDRFDERTTPVTYSPDTTVIPFRLTQNGLISVETELDQTHHINAILDSGASSTVVSAAAVERLKLHDSIIKGQTVKVVGAAGVSDNVKLILIRHCRVADLRQENLRALILNFEAINETSGFEQSGILGGDFLRNFRVTIDFSNGKIAFQPYTASIHRN
ncbi:MAG: aspartyl protease family protein [Blastocatellia bacterium]|nr:aspartyl protease family protein [Blastocatellia bacterium]